MPMKMTDVTDKEFAAMTEEEFFGKPVQLKLPLPNGNPLTGMSVAQQAKTQAAIAGYILKQTGDGGSNGCIQKTPLETQIGGDHYKQRPIQPVEYIHANNLGFIEGSIVKYITRWRTKGEFEDLRKIQHYVELLISLEESGKDRKANDIVHGIVDKTTIRSEGVRDLRDRPTNLSGLREGNPEAKPL